MRVGFPIALASWDWIGLFKGRSHGPTVRPRQQPPAPQLDPPSSQSVSSQYQINFGGGWALYEEIGVRRDWAKRAILAPDVVRHMIPEQVGIPDAPAFSFFSRRVETRQTAAIVVQTMRKDTVLTVLGTFPIPHSVMSRVNSLDPIALLAELAEQFGHELTITNRRAKFILYERIEVDPMTTRFELFRVDQSGEKLLINVFFRASQSRDGIEVALAMAIDTARYRAAITN